MGLYTDVRANFLLTTYGTRLIEDLYFHNNWHILAEAAGRQGPWWLRQYAVWGRSNFIPFGMWSHGPDPLVTADDGLVGPRWVFHCSAKNVNSVVEAFSRLIIPNVVEYVRQFESRFDSCQEEDWLPIPHRISEIV